MDNKHGLSDLSACNAQAEAFKAVVHDKPIKAGLTAIGVEAILMLQT